MRSDRKRAPVLGGGEAYMTQSELSGIRVLVVEDDPLIALLLEEMLEGLGCVLAGSAQAVDVALELAGQTPFPAAAILDVNLNGRSSRPVAERLLGAGVPVVFATGYGSSGVADMPGGCVVLEKPFTQKQVGDALAQALGV